MTPPMHLHPAMALFRILGVPQRLAVFQRVARRPASAGELAQGLPITRAAVVQHLTVLRRHGLVEPVTAGRRRVYHATSEGLVPLRDWLTLHDKKNAQEEPCPPPSAAPPTPMPKRQPRRSPPPSRA